MHLFLNISWRRGVFARSGDGLLSFLGLLFDPGFSLFDSFSSLLLRNLKFVVLRRHFLNFLFLLHILFFILDLDFFICMVSFRLLFLEFLRLFFPYLLGSLRPLLLTLGMLLNVFCVTHQLISLVPGFCQSGFCLI